jgi:ABC-2 type transport system permease protein
MESKVYVIPGIVALLLLIITVFLTSMSIVREKEIGTLEQLMVTPLRSSELILGKVIPFSILGMIEISIAMVLVYLLFGIGVEGSVALLFAESALFILTTLGVGILISTISETQQQALFVGWFFMIFAIMLSGFFVPIANMPDAIQWVTYLNPMRYFLVILREIYLKGSSLEYLLPETLAMILFGITVFSAAVWRYKRRLA